MIPNGHKQSLFYVSSKMAQVLPSTLEQVNGKYAANPQASPNKLHGDTEDLNGDGRRSKSPAAQLPSTDVPEACPGTQSESAGKTSTCAGCPNQQICSSGAAREVDPAIDQIKLRLKNVRHKILILSGKGGVGKSTVSSMIARALARKKSVQVGVLDIDICGPSIPRLFGLEGEQVHQSGSGWCPIYPDENIAVMSIGFLLASLDDAVIWRGPKKNGIIKQFLRDVDWDELDYLIIDTPPGTSDEHLSVVQYLREAGIDGAVIVTTPQEVSLLDVRKEINFCRKVGVPIIGVVENMRDFDCPKCHKTSTILPATSGGAAKMCQDMDVPLLASLALNAVVAESCDRSCNIFDDDAVAQLAGDDNNDDVVQQLKLTLQKNLDKLRGDYVKIADAIRAACNAGSNG